MRAVRAHSVADFRVTSLLPNGVELFFGGETLNNCSFKGTAAIFRLGPSGVPEKFWDDDELFNSSVTGLAKAGEKLMVSVQHERSLGLELPIFKGLELNKKHFSEASGAQVEASLFTLSEKGATIERQLFTAGLNIHVTGLVAGTKGPWAYGTLGGMPWLAFPQSSSPWRTQVETAEFFRR